ncbi:hypothetical protein ACWESM_18745 [Nocardia sp. NPDC003999]
MSAPIDDIVDAEVQPRPRIQSYTYERVIETREVIVSFDDIVDAGTDLLLEDLRAALATAEHLPDGSIVTIRTDGVGRLERLTFEHRVVVS